MRLNDYTLDEQMGTFSGRVELLFNVGGTPQWGTVCSQGIGQREAQAICNTIGFTYGTHEHARGPPGRFRILVAGGGGAIKLDRCGDVPVCEP